MQKMGGGFSVNEPTISFSIREDKEKEIKAILTDILDKVNIDLHSDRTIYDFRIREKPFERTSTGKIKRTEYYY